MKVHVELDGGLLADRFGKYASEPDRLEGFPVRSFPIEINDVPQEARTIALAFVDYDAIPVGGFCWIHWTACNLPATTTLIPEDASRTGTVDMVQGRNSNWSPMAHGSDNPQVHSRYCGPQPPDATHSYTLNVYALDCELGLPEGFYQRAASRDERPCAGSGVRGAAEPRVGSMRCAAPFDSPDKGDSYSNETDSVVWRCME